MGLFDFFKKKETAPEAQEALDKGLEKTKEGFLSKITKAVAGKSTVDVALKNAQASAEREMKKAGYYK